MSKLVVPADERRPRSLWLNISFTLMWTSAAASGFGDRLIELAAVPLLGVKGQDANASAIQASIYFFFFLPWLVMTPVGGWLADTLPRKWLLFAADLGRAAILLLAFLMVPAGLGAEGIPPSEHWKIFAILIGVGALAAIFSPAKAATVPQIVPVAHLQAANSVVLGIGVIASLIGFAIGGPLMQHWGVRAGVLVAFLAYGISGWFWAFLQVRPHDRAKIQPRKRSQLLRMVQAGRYIARHRSVLQLVGLGVLFWAAANVVLSAIAALCKHYYGIPAETYLSYYAYMAGMTGLGLLCGALAIVWVNNRRASGLVTMLGLLLSSLAMLGLAFNRSYALGLAMAFCIGFFGNAAMICVETLLQSLVPNYIRGRVFGVRDMASMISAVLINLAIWKTPDIDQRMVPLLYIVAGILFAVSASGGWMLLTRGPMTTRLANAVWRLGRIYCLVWHRARWIGKDHVPHAGPVILAANHTSAIDPVLIQSGSHRLVCWLMLKAHRYRLATPIWQALKPIALEREAGDALKLRHLLARLKKNEVIGIFPQGALGDRSRTLRPLQPGIALLARRSNALIVPVWVQDTPRPPGWMHLLFHFVIPSRSTVVFGDPYRPAAEASNEAIVAELDKRLRDLETQLRQRGNN